MVHAPLDVELESQPSMTTIRQPERPQQDLGAAANAGAMAGLAAGVALLLGLLALDLFQGQDIWVSMKTAAAPIIGARAFEPGFALGPILLGLVIHLATSAAWGAPFGMICRNMGPNATVGMGLVWGLAVWMGMFRIALPLVGLGEMAGNVPTGRAIGEHLFFGVALAIAFLPYRRPDTLRI